MSDGRGWVFLVSILFSVFCFLFSVFFFLFSVFNVFVSWKPYLHFYIAWALLFTLCFPFLFPFYVINI